MPDGHDAAIRQDLNGMKAVILFCAERRAPAHFPRKGEVVDDRLFSKLSPGIDLTGKNDGVIRRCDP